ncbi:MAG TPA: 30S ribosomal protein S16 [Streptomyces sp.]|nr:30S ribosomal protein S16 [Streptomyces sp.]
MAVKIKLKRLGKIRSPHYRIVVSDSRTRRDGRAIEEIGLYHPVQNPSRIEVNAERAQYWLSVGAQPTEPVLAILKLTGDWQAHKGLPAPAPLLVAEPKADKRALFEALTKDAADEPKGEAITPKAKKAEKKADEPAEDAASPAAAAEPTEA